MPFEKKRLIKKTGIVALTICGVYALLLTVLSIYTITNKNKIVTLIRTDLSNLVQGNVQIGDADVSVWKSFPNIEVSLKNFSITDSVYHIPFLKMKEVDVRVSIIDIIRSKSNIHKLQLYDAVLHIFTDTTGYSNRYVITSKKKASGTNNNNAIGIDKIIFNNVEMVIENKRSQKRYALHFYYLDASLHKKDSLLKIYMTEKCLVRGLGFDLSKGSYLNNQTLEATWNIVINTNNLSLSFDETKVNFNEHPFYLSGIFYLKDSKFSLKVRTSQVSYKQATQLLPQNVQQRMNMFSLSRSVDVIASIGGSLLPKTNPLVNVSWTTSNNNITTPVASFTECSFTGNFTNQLSKSLPLVDSNSAIIINNFKGKYGSINLTGKEFIVSNLTTPVLQFHFFSQCSFQQLDETLGFNTVRFVEGNARVYFGYIGPLLREGISVDKLKIGLHVENGKISYEPRNLIFTNCRGDMVLSEDFLQVNDLQCDMNKNHFVVNISGEQFSNFTNPDTAKANITCNVFTPSMDLADFTGLFSKRPAPISSPKKKRTSIFADATIDSVLHQGNVQVNIKADKIQYQNFTAQNAQAQLLFMQSDWRIKQASMQQSGGLFTIRANIHQVSSNYQQAAATLNMQNVNIRQLFYSFNNFGQQGIEYKNLQGTVTANANITFGINNKGSLIANSLGGNVDFDIKNGALINYKPIEKLQDYFLQNKNLDHVEFAELKNRLDIKNGDIHINRMQIASTAVNIFVEGIYSLKNNTDISIQIPFNNLKSNTGNFKTENKGNDVKGGKSIYLRAKSDKNGGIKIGLDLFHKFRNKL